MTGHSGSLEVRLGELLEAVTGSSAPIRMGSWRRGGSINRTAVASQGNRQLFVKLNAVECGGMFEAERDGLLELAQAGTLRVPEPLCCGTHGAHAFLVMEHLDLQPRGDSAALGRGLAAMHRIESDQFGWRRDNTIGLTPQHNKHDGDWARFWRTQRLGFQLELARDNGFGAELVGPGMRLLDGIGDLMRGHNPAASLLHGDLWRGNAAFLPDGRPVVFDPAVYFGDRETDLAMCELFGGFEETFFSAYRDQYPMDQGYSVRRDLYQLYHVLNHLNLFGGAYLAQSRNLVLSLLAKLN